MRMLTSLHNVVIGRLRSYPSLLVRAFDNPVRRAMHRPEVLFGTLVRQGDTVIDVGCGPGYFTTALAGLVGPQGRVLAADIRPGMLQAARQSAQRSGMLDRITFVHCTREQLGITERADFVLAFWMVHEVGRARTVTFLRELRTLMKPGARLLIAEPKVHVPAEVFARVVAGARDAGFAVSEGPPVRLSRSILCWIDP